MLIPNLFVGTVANIMKNILFFFSYNINNIPAYIPLTLFLKILFLAGDNDTKIQSPLQVINNGIIPYFENSSYIKKDDHCGRLPHSYYSLCYW